MNGACTSFLGEPEQKDGNLGSRDRVRKRTMAGPSRHPEEMGKLCEREALASPVEKAPGEPDGVDHRCSTASTGETLDGTVEERDVEAGIVGDQRGVAGEGQEATHRRLGARRPPQVLLPDPGQRRHERRQERPWVDERLERLHEFEGPDAHGADLTDPAAGRRESGRLEVENDELGVFERGVEVRRAGEAYPSPEPLEARIVGDDVGEQGACEFCGRPLEREERARRFFGRDRTVPRLHELDEPVRGVERELHESRVYERMFDLQERCQTPARGAQHRNKISTENSASSLASRGTAMPDLRQGSGGV